MKQTIEELRHLQEQPLERKILMTRQRLREWVEHFGEDGVYVSFSGGKDSTVLLDIVRNEGYTNIPAVFVDVPTQFPELREFAKTFENVEIIKPKISFYEVCDKYGFPLISKEVSECVQGARKYLKTLETESGGRYHYYYDKVVGKGKYEKKENIPSADVEALKNPSGGATTASIENSEELANLLNQRMRQRQGGNNQRLAQMLGMLTKDQKIKANIPECDRSAYSQVKYKFFLDAPFEISNRCCNIMKKDPAHRYSKETGRKPITAQMTAESRLRTQKWLVSGCNAFDNKLPISNPMAFWTENDVLEYIYLKKLPICSVYGDVVEDYEEEIEGQMTFTEITSRQEKKKYKTTGCDRTGCVLCGFGCHLEKGETRFQKLHKTHPGLYGLLDKVQNNGVTYREAIDWTNSHGNVNIRY